MREFTILLVVRFESRSARKGRLLLETRVSRVREHEIAKYLSMLLRRVRAILELLILDHFND